MTKEGGKQQPSYSDFSTMIPLKTICIKYHIVLFITLVAIYQEPNTSCCDNKDMIPQSYGSRS